MIVEYKGRKSNWDDKWLKTLTKDEFEVLCLDTSTFKLMLLKERNAKIKELYGKLHSDVKKVSKSESGEDVLDNNVESNGGDSRAESRANDGGQNIKGKEDKAKIQKQKLRSEEEKTKL